VELVTIAGAGHQWPGQPGPKGPIAAQLDPPFHGLDATSTIWSFFQAHPKHG
jgi:polyhydroxybutyrate depolymerase